MSEEKEISAQKYDALLSEFCAYQQQISEAKEKQLSDLDSHINESKKLYQQLQKKYQDKLQEEELIFLKKQKKAQEKYKKLKQQMKSTIKLKDQQIHTLINELTHEMNQKTKIIEDHTTILCEIAKQNEETSIRQGPSRTAYTQLTKLYQYILQENNSLKKQLHRSHHISKRDQQSVTKGKKSKNTSIQNAETSIRKKKKQKTKK